MKRIAVKALKLFSVFAELIDLCLVHVCQQLLRRFTEPVDLLRLALTLKLFLCTCGTLTSQSTSRLCIVVVHPALVRFAWNSVVHHVPSGLLEALRLALCFPR